MAAWWKNVEKAIDFAAGVIGSGSAEADPNRPGRPPERTASQDPGQTRGLVSAFEAKMAGVLVSALQEAFNRDAARLDAEKQQAEHERRRAELALQLEVARQAAEREAARLKAVGLLALVVWLASLLYVTVHPVAGAAGRVLLGLAWACLTAAIAAAFVAYGKVREMAARLPGSAGPDLGATSPVPVPRFPAADAASWLAVGGLALAAGSLLVSM